MAIKNDDSVYNGDFSRGLIEGNLHMGGSLVQTHTNASSGDGIQEHVRHRMVGNDVTILKSKNQGSRLQIESKKDDNNRRNTRDQKNI